MSEPDEDGDKPRSWEELVDEFSDDPPAEEAIREYRDSEELDRTPARLEDLKGRWKWMTETRHQRMFKEIEAGLQGVIGTGLYEWVDRRVFDQVFDRMTLMAVYKLMKSGVLNQLDWPIARGKEAHVFHGQGVDGPVAVKIFHTSNAVFRNLMKYIEGDPRFGGLKRKHRDLVTVWVRKEHRNMLRMRKAGLKVPEPLALHQNVLVMSYLGTEEGPSPRLKDVKVEDPDAVFVELAEFLRVCWNEARLAHADFSEYNVLWHDGGPVVIDVGQAVQYRHPHAKEFLVRDVQRLVDWAKKQGLERTLEETLYDVLN